jgi:hypothetical protein
MFASIQSALATVPFFPVGLAMGALAAAKGIINIQAIKSATMGGGGAVGTFSANPSTGLPESPSAGGFQAPPSPIQSQGVAAQVPRVVNLHLTGEGFFTTAQIRDQIVPALQEAYDSGVKVNVTNR